MGRGLARLPPTLALPQLILEMFIIQKILLENHIFELIFSVPRNVFILHIFINHDNHIHGSVNITIYLMHLNDLFNSFKPVERQDEERFIKIAVYYVTS